MTCPSTSMPLVLRMLAFSVLLLVVGCKEKPLAQSALRTTGITVTLHAPDKKGHYLYSIHDHRGALLHWFLGPAMIPYPPQPHVAPEASDSNQANSEQSF